MSRIKALPHKALKGLVWPVRLTRAGMVAERITRAFWPVWTLLFSVISALAFGLHASLPVEAVWAGAVLSVGGLIWALYRGMRRFRWPSRDEAYARLDMTLPGQPIAALSDAQALGSEDPGSTLVWRKHIARMADRVGDARAPAPDLRVSHADRYALRYASLTAFVIALGFGSIWRVTEVPALAGGSTALADGPVWEAWAEPPAYTRRPSLYLNTINEDVLSLPAGSRITVRLYGDADALRVEERVSGRPPAIETPDAPADTSVVRAIDFEAVQSGTLSIVGESGRSWQLTVVPDTAPQVEITGTIMREADGTMSQPFVARDDYAVTAGRAIIELDLDAVDRRYGLGSDPEPRDTLIYDLPMPITGDRADFAETLVEDASKHSWALLPVTMRFEVTDGRNQTGTSDPVSLTLPGRRFFDPVAAAVIELRRDLLWTRDNGPRVSQILHALTHRPEGLLRNERAYLMLRVAMRRLDGLLDDAPLTAEARDELSEAFWEIAELIEDGGLADALDRMQQAQERLSEAIRNGATPEEIEKLMDELRQATDDYIRKLAENMERKGADEPNQQAENGAAMTGDQLQEMMDEIQRLMEEGRMAEAQELLDQLSRMMENLRVTEGQSGEGQRQNGPGDKAMEDLRQTLRDQQDLSDEAFRDLQRQFGQQPGEGQQGQQQDGQQGEQPGQNGQDGQPQPGQQGQEGNGTDPQGRQSGNGRQPGSLAERQQSLRDALRQQEGGLPGDSSTEGDAARRSLDQAGDAMKGAEQALRQGDLPEALERQAEAIENLREGMRNLGDALARNQSEQPGSQGQAGAEGTRESSRDPLGRTTGQSGRIGSDENLLQGQDVYRRARDLLDEIRRRSGETTRSADELDYLKRLLDRF
ncbi:MAG: TIGR02302 family protein [Albidovulum sp.]